MEGGGGWGMWAWIEVGEVVLVVGKWELGSMLVLGTGVGRFVYFDYGTL
mgnify:CR=1 FL=1